MQAGTAEAREKYADFYCMVENPFARPFVKSAFEAAARGSLVDHSSVNFYIGMARGRSPTLPAPVIEEIERVYEAHEPARTREALNVAYRLAESMDTDSVKQMNYWLSLAEKHSGGKMPIERSIAETIYFLKESERRNSHAEAALISARDFDFPLMERSFRYARNHAHHPLEEMLLAVMEAGIGAYYRIKQDLAGMRAEAKDDLNGTFDYRGRFLQGAG
jgi:hypothetical protein